MSRIYKTAIEEKPTGNQVSVGTTAVQLTNQANAMKGIKIKALPGNSGVIYVGFNSGVTTSNGYPLQAGSEVTINMEDPSVIYVISGDTSQGVAWLVH